MHSTAINMAVLRMQFAIIKEEGLTEERIRKMDESIRKVQHDISLIEKQSAILNEMELEHRSMRCAFRSIKAISTEWLADQK